MRPKLHTVVAIATIGCLAMPGAAVAQKKTQPSSKPGIAAFRCDYNNPTEACTTSPDAIEGDSSGYEGIGGPETGEGAYLTSGGELWIGIGSGVHEVQITVPPTALDGPPCKTSGSCRLLNPLILIDQENGEIQSNVLDPATGADTATLVQMPVGATWRSRLQFSFYDEKTTNLLWGLNFNPLNYPDATPLNVTRTSACTWVFAPGAGDVAGLRAYGTLSGGKKTTTYEGLYAIDFELTFSVPSMCPVQ